MLPCFARGAESRAPTCWCCVGTWNLIETELLRQILCDGGKEQHSFLLAVWFHWRGWLPMGCSGVGALSCCKASPFWGLKAGPCIAADAATLCLQSAVLLQAKLYLSAKRKCISQISKPRLKETKQHARAARSTAVQAKEVGAILVSFLLPWLTPVQPMRHCGGRRQCSLLS